MTERSSPGVLPVLRLADGHGGRTVPVAVQATSLSAAAGGYRALTVPALPRTDRRRSNSSLLEHDTRRCGCSGADESSGGQPRRDRGGEPLGPVARCADQGRYTPRPLLIDRHHPTRCTERAQRFGDRLCPRDLRHANCGAVAAQAASIEAVEDVVTIREVPHSSVVGSCRVSSDRTSTNPPGCAPYIRRAPCRRRRRARRGRARLVVRRRCR